MVRVVTMPMAMPGTAAISMVVVVVVIVTVQKVWSPDENGTENDDDSASDDVRDISNGRRKAGGNASEKEADGETSE